MLFPLVLSLPSVCIKDKSFRMAQMIFLYFTKKHTKNNNNNKTTMNMIDTFSDLFPRARGQWWVKLPKNSMPANLAAISQR